jgi:hypothetical protein
MIVKMYLINEIPFTFDELPEIASTDPEMMQLADKYRRYEPEDLYKNSFYLIDEEAHPCLFPVDLENPEDMPQDEYYEFEEEDLTS